jgi:hypothetical protein
VSNQNLQAASVLRETHGHILDSLARIPQTINSVEHAREIFHTDTVLRDLTIELYFTILEAVDGMVVYLTQSSVAGSSSTSPLQCHL